jgi:hypothetical protein
MKKILIFAALCMVAAFAFASDFTVQSVTGSVMRESGNQRVAVRTGDVLNESVVIQTGIGASLVLVDANRRTINVPAARNGKITDLLSTQSGVRITGNVTRVDTGQRVAAGNIVTGSARASDAAEGDDIAAE